jgi:hypothetical protein
MTHNSDQDAHKAAQREKSRQLRRAAYEKAKMAQASDPQMQARKEEAKVRRRELYQKIKAALKDHKNRKKAAAKKEATAALASMLKRGSDLKAEKPESPKPEKVTNSSPKTPANSARHLRLVKS